MTYLEWKPEYSVGVDAIDEEHREMIELINTTYRNLETSATDEEIEKCLGEIYAGISAHFALEERIMQKAHYKEYHAHKEDHEDLLDQIHDMMDEFIEDPQAGAVSLQTKLSKWFSTHFATFDARLHKDLPH